MKTLAIFLVCALLYFVIGALIGYFAYLRPLAKEAKTHSLSDDDLFVATTCGFLAVVMFWPFILILVVIGDAIDKAREFSDEIQLCNYDEDDYGDEDEHENEEAL